MSIAPPRIASSYIATRSSCCRKLLRFSSITRGFTLLLLPTIFARAAVLAVWLCALSCTLFVDASVVSLPCAPLLHLSPSNCSNTVAVLRDCGATVGGFSRAVVIAPDATALPAEHRIRNFSLLISNVSGIDVVVENVTMRDSMLLVVNTTLDEAAGTPALTMRGVALQNSEVVVYGAVSKHSLLLVESCDMVNASIVVSASATLSSVSLVLNFTATGGSQFVVRDTTAALAFSVSSSVVVFRNTSVTGGSVIAVVRCWLTAPGGGSIVRHVLLSSSVVSQSSVVVESNALHANVLVSRVSVQLVDTLVTHGSITVANNTWRLMSQAALTAFLVLFLRSSIADSDVAVVGVSTGDSTAMVYVFALQSSSAHNASISVRNATMGSGAVVDVRHSTVAACVVDVAWCHAAGAVAVLQHLTNVTAAAGTQFVVRDSTAAFTSTTWSVVLLHDSTVSGASAVVVVRCQLMSRGGGSIVQLDNATISDGSLLGIERSLLEAFFGARHIVVHSSVVSESSVVVDNSALHAIFEAEGASLVHFQYTLVAHSSISVANNTWLLMSRTASYCYVVLFSVCTVVHSEVAVVAMLTGDSMATVIVFALQLSGAHNASISVRNATIVSGVFASVLDASVTSCVVVVAWCHAAGAVAMLLAWANVTATGGSDFILRDSTADATSSAHAVVRLRDGCISGSSVLVLRCRLTSRDGGSVVLLDTMTISSGSRVGVERSVLAVSSSAAHTLVLLSVVLQSSVVVDGNALHANVTMGGMGSVQLQNTSVAHSNITLANNSWRLMTQAALYVSLVLLLQSSIVHSDVAVVGMSTGDSTATVYVFALDSSSAHYASIAVRNATIGSGVVVDVRHCTVAACVVDVAWCHAAGTVAALMWFTNVTAAGGTQFVVRNSMVIAFATLDVVRPVVWAVLSSGFGLVCPEGEGCNELIIIVFNVEIQFPGVEAVRIDAGGSLLVKLDISQTTVIHTHRRSDEDVIRRYTRTSALYSAASYAVLQILTTGTSNSTKVHFVIDDCLFFGFDQLLTVQATDNSSVDPWLSAVLYCSLWGSVHNDSGGSTKYVWMNSPRFLSATRYRSSLLLRPYSRVNRTLVCPASRSATCSKTDSTPRSKTHQITPSFFQTVTQVAPRRTASRTSFEPPPARVAFASAAVDAIQTEAQIAATVALLGAFGGGAPGDAVVLAALTLLSCGGITPWQDTNAGPQRFLISVFYDNGPIASLFGNLGLAAAFALLHALVYVYRLRAVPAVTGTAGSGDSSHAQMIGASLFFPSLSHTVFVFLVSGAMFAVGHAVASVTAVVAAVTCIGAAALVGGVLFIVLRHVHRNVWPAVSVKDVALSKYEAYVPRSACRLLPSTRWQPPDISRANSSLFASMRDLRHVRAHFIFQYYACVFTLVASVPFTGDGCVVQYVLLSLCVAVPAGHLIASRLSAVRRPLSNYFLLTSYIATIGVLISTGIVARGPEAARAAATVSCTVFAALLSTASLLKTLYEWGVMVLEQLVHRATHDVSGVSRHNATAVCPRVKRLELLLLKICARAHSHAVASDATATLITAASSRNVSSRTDLLARRRASYPTNAGHDDDAGVFRDNASSMPRHMMMPRQGTDRGTPCSRGREFAQRSETPVHKNTKRDDDVCASINTLMASSVRGEPISAQERKSRLEMLCRCAAVQACER